MTAPTFRVCRDVRFRPFPPEWVVLKQARGEVMVVNEVAGRILELLDAQPRSVPQLAQALAEEFEAPVEVLERDVHGFVTRLVADTVVEPT